VLNQVVHKVTTGLQMFKCLCNQTSYRYIITYNFCFSNNLVNYCFACRLPWKPDSTIVSD